MSILKMQDRFRVAETRWVENLFDTGFDLEIAHISHAAYQKWAKKRVSESPLARRTTEAFTKLQVIQTTLGKQADSAAASYLAKADLGDTTTWFTDEDVEGIALLIRNWRSRDGEPLDYSHQEAVALLRSQQPLDSTYVFRPGGPGGGASLNGSIEAVKEATREAEENPAILILDAGTSLGRAIAQAVTWHAQQHEEFRRRWSEEARGNSQPS